MHGKGSNWFHNPCQTSSLGGVSWFAKSFGKLDWRLGSPKCGHPETQWGIPARTVRIQVATGTKSIRTGRKEEKDALMVKESSSSVLKCRNNVKILRTLINDAYSFLFIPHGARGIEISKWLDLFSQILHHAFAARSTSPKAATSFGSTPRWEVLNISELLKQQKSEHIWVESVELC